MSIIFLKKSVRFYANTAMFIGLLMTSQIVIMLALVSYIIHGVIKSELKN